VTFAHYENKLACSPLCISKEWYTNRWVEESCGALIARAKDALGGHGEGAHNQVWSAKDGTGSIICTLSNVECDHLPIRLAVLWSPCALGTYMVQPHLGVGVCVTSIWVLESSVHTQNHTLLTWFVNGRAGPVVDHAFSTLSTR
jgi:hypothetical protein